MEESPHELLLKAISEKDNDRAINILNNGCDQLALDSGLCWASRYGYCDIIPRLLENGANPNAVVWGGFTALLWAAMYSPNPEVVKILLLAGSYVDHSSSKRRQTALHAAVIRGNVQCANLLLDAGANLDVQDYLFKTPLLHAVQRGHIPCIKLLIRYNCNVNLTGWVNGTSMSPLVLALVQNNLETTKLLILAGARFERLAIYQNYKISQYYETVENNLQLEVRPIYLQQHCRICIRHLLRPQFLDKLRQIELPHRLQQYLQIDEMDY